MLNFLVCWTERRKFPASLFWREFAFVLPAKPRNLLPSLRQNHEISLRHRGLAYCFEHSILSGILAPISFLLTGERLRHPWFSFFLSGILVFIP